MSVYYVITTYSSLLKNFFYLKGEDLILTRLPIREENYALLFDLQARGVISFPSFLSQIISSSKVAQSMILKEFMPPYTYVITNQVSLLQVLQNPPPYEKFITKKDRANCGLGIKLWRNLEEIFNHAGTPALEFPFVLQPFFEDWKDIRVILLGDKYVEAYLRENRKNFRQNLFFGGKASPYTLSSHELEFCEKITERAAFPYAHLDLAYIEGKGPFLSEINLKGGIKGARITVEAYEAIIRDIEREFFESWKREHQPFKLL
ncbi:MAG: RimK family alpha-L-glutamate ligase [Caldimicrobium sp.]